MNSWSVASSDGLIRIRLSLAKTARSTTLFCGTCCQVEAGNLHQVHQPDGGDQVEIVSDHRDLAPALEPDERLGIDLGDLGAGRIVVADGGHVADRAVGQMKQDDKLL